jgi:adenylate kinase family enzyme
MSRVRGVVAFATGTLRIRAVDALSLPKRIVVVGCAGAGKTTLSASIAARLGVRHVERDELGELGGAEYRAAVAELAGTDEWVFDGAPYYVDEVVYSRADVVVALDYPRRVVMRRVTWRALRRPDARRWRDPEHPVRWAWFVWAQRRREVADLERRPELASAEVVRLRSPADARKWLASLP